MSYREVAMWEVLNVLRRIGRGEDKSAVARTTGHSRATVGRYVATARELGWRTVSMAAENRTQMADENRTPGRG